MRNPFVRGVETPEQSAATDQLQFTVTISAAPTGYKGPPLVTTITDEQGTPAE